VTPLGGDRCLRFGDRATIRPPARLGGVAYARWSIQRTRGEGQGERGVTRIGGYTQDGCSEPVRGDPRRLDGEPRECLQAETPEQKLTEARPRPFKHGLICRDYRSLSQQLLDREDAASGGAFLCAVVHGSAVSWQHITLPDEKLQGPVGITPQTLQV